MPVGYVSEIFSSFQGEGIFAGRRHVFLRMASCNLRCVYCDTPESLERTSHCNVYRETGRDERRRNPLSVMEVAALLSPFLSSRRGVHALAVTGGEPLLQESFLAALLETAPPPVPVLLETNGTHPDRLQAVLPFVQIVSMDVKLPSNSGESGRWAEHREFLILSRGKTVYVKVPVDENTREQEVREAALLVAEASPNSVFFLQPILSSQLQLQISPARLDQFYDIAIECLADVRIMPQMHRFLGVS